MKKLDKFILQSFVGPYVLSFFIAEFVLIMQFLWKYIDDILGKGFSMLDIMELVLYYAASITPMALPISILLSSVMVYGDISEKYELSSMKSAGISLLRVMRPAIYLSIATALFSVFASNYVKPISTYQFKKRFDLIRKQKSTLSIEEGIFNNEFRDIIIRVGEKARNEKDVKDVIIYDHSLPDKSLLNMIKADSAEMFATEDGHYFVMNLQKGEQYQELERNRKDNGHMAYPLVRTSFEKWSKVIDMSNFYLSESDLNISRNREDMLNTLQLLRQIDTINLNIHTHKSKAVLTYAAFEGKKMLDPLSYQEKIRSEKKEVFRDTHTKKTQAPTVQKPIARPSSPAVNTENAYLLHKERMKELQQEIDAQKGQSKSPSKPFQSNAGNGSFRRLPDYNLKSVSSFYETFDSVTRNNIVMRAIPAVTANMDLANAAFYNVDNAVHQKQIYILRLGQQYSFSLVCILFLFIGAPLGSIIRKGGYGYPLLVAILFYMLFIISTIVGEKLVKSDTFPGWFGAWLPCLLLLPFGIYFTYQALNDARFSWMDKVEQAILKVFKPFVTTSR